MSFLRVFRFLLRFVGDLPVSRLQIALVVLAGLVSGAASAAFIALINSALEEPSAARRLLLPFAALVVLLPAARFVANVLLLRLAERAVMEVRLELCRRIVGSPLRKLEEVGGHRQLSVLTEDVNTLVGACANLPEILINLALMTGLLAYLGWLSWQMMLVVLAAIILGAISYEIPMLRAQRHFERWREIWDRVFELLKGSVEGVKELKMHAARRRAFLDSRLRDASERLRRESVVANTIYSGANSWGQVLFFVLVGVVLFGLGGVAGFDRSLLTGYTLAIIFMITPLDILLHQLPALGRAEVAWANIHRLGLALEQAGSDDSAETPAAFDAWQALHLEGVTHSYGRPGASEVFSLGPLDLELQRGDLVFLVGGNGSGKTTLAKILLGLYPPQSGRLRVGETEVDDAKRGAYRQLFSVVFTDFFLFDALLGLEGPELDRRARAWLKRLGLAERVKVEGGALSTLAVSQGQRKRLALLTALLEDRPLYLFDEWAAEQDPRFKEAFYRSLLPELKARGKTVFVISHDDRYYGLADRVLKLEDGRLVEDYRPEADGKLQETSSILQPAVDASGQAPAAASQSCSREEACHRL